MDNNKFDTLKTLVEAIGPTGFESEIMSTFSGLIEPYVDNIEEDNVGNLYAEIKGNKDQHIMVHAHADTVGWMVKYIDEITGFIFTDDITGFNSTDHRELPGQEVLIVCRKDGKTYPGNFVPTMPEHLREEDDDDQNRYDLAIDMGFVNGKQTKAVVSVGDIIIMKPELKRGCNKSRIIGTSLDNRVGLLCLIEIAKGLKKYKNRPTVTFVATAVEEGSGGITTSCANLVDPDLAVCIDVEPATDCIVYESYDTVIKKYWSIELGKGAVLTRGMSIDEKAFSVLEKCAQKSGTPVQYMTAGCSTENVNTYRNGSRSALVSIPCRNCHTNVEIVHDTDINDTVNLCIQLIKNY